MTFFFNNAYYKLSSNLSYSELLINCLSSKDNYFLLHSVSLLYQAPLARGSSALPSVLYYIYICLWSKKKFESYFRDPLTFSNVDSRTSRRIYRLALLLRAPETLSSLSKSRISIFNAHLTLLVRKMTSHNSIGKYRHLVN